MLAKPKFEKVVGGWRFTIGDKTFFAARRADLGWKLWQARSGDAPYGLRDEDWIDRGELESRSACVGAARIWAGRR